MRDLTKADIKKIVEAGNVIEIYDDFMSYTFTFYYVYSGDSREAIFLNEKFFEYLDIDEYTDKIEEKYDEKKIITKLLKEQVEEDYYTFLERLNFIDSNIINDIRGEKYERKN